jgi:RNA polymerase sigma-70 factor (ECF subfamily)
VSELADNLIMLKVRDGEVGKLGLLFERHHLPLYNYFLRQTGRRDASEDLVQEVFLRMLKYRQGYRGESAFTVWMYRIARNAWVDYFKKAKRELPWDENADDPVSDDPNPNDDLEESQTLSQLRTALAKLSPEKREVLVLSRYQDMKYEEIAELLGCAVGTVKARVHRALKDLKDIYFELSQEKMI